MTSFLGDLLDSKNEDLNAGQRRALKLMADGQNIFITGGAGTGKSFLLRRFLKGIDDSRFPVLASTGAAAVLIGGRTFHSFFGLGILEGGPDATLERALKDRRLAKRLKKISGFVLDEISMIPGIVLETAERIASLVRGDDRPWGGLKVVAVGDFAQLPPISQGSRKKDWAFLNDVWQKSDFQPVQLTEMMRAREDTEYCEILADIRQGQVTERVKNMLDWRTQLECDDEIEATVLHARKVDVDRINMLKLAMLEGEQHSFETEYTGEDRYKKMIEAQAPVSSSLELKKGALVMCRQNDPKGRWVNGSLGHVKDIDKNEIMIRLLGGNHVCIEKARFTMMNAEGEEVATAKNFPLNLAYALTIHKSQGATIDRAMVSLKQLWEPGQAYVALSRVKSSNGLIVQGWDRSSIFADPQVTEFHQNLSK